MLDDDARERRKFFTLWIYSYCVEKLLYCSKKKVVGYFQCKARVFL
jgi:hypothetical protein